MTDEATKKSLLIDELARLKKELSDLKSRIPSPVGQVPPQAAETQPVTTPGAGSQALKGTETILVVEDNEMFREFIVEVLGRFGYRVLEAQDAETARQMVDSHPDAIDLILTDVVMPPGVSGKDLVAQIRKRRPELKVLFMSGYIGNLIAHDDVLDAVDSGEVFLQKPFSMDTLLTTLRQQLDAKDPLRP
jgi:two-component system cell cycle sensor histidine kinase/response regulator CckA